MHSHCSRRRSTSGRASCSNSGPRRRTMSILWRAGFAIVLACTVAVPSWADGPGSNVRANGVVVVTHLDIIPTFTDLARPLLDQFVKDSRNDPGVVVFKMISW